MIDVTGYIDIKITVVLWIIAFAIKHINWKPIKKVSNQLIPVIVSIIGVILSCYLYKISLDSAIIGFVSAMFSVGIHSSGKNIFKFAGNTFVNQIKEIDTNIEEDTDDENSVG